MISKQDIRNYSYTEMIEYCKSRGEKSFRAQQIFKWLYIKGIDSYVQMSNIPETFRQQLKKDLTLDPLVVINSQTAKDGTTKFLFQLSDHESIETVLIPSKTRTTVCVSTQVGCKYGCIFCASGLGGWKRHLTCAEILAQVLYMKKESLRFKKILSHVVFMGTGESLDNYENLLKAVRIINDKKGLNIGARRMTISTVGILPQIEKLAKEKLQVELAISLHGYNDASRNLLVPINRKYPFKDLLQTCKEYIRCTNRQITFEYILIKDITCTNQAAKELAKYLKGMLCKINLIPYNPIKEFNYQTPTKRDVYSFRDQLLRLGIHATVRLPRGRDVQAACGQLRRAQIFS